MKTYIFHISGIHCASCKILIEDILNEQGDVSNVDVNLKNETVTFSIPETDQQKILWVLSKKIEGYGYILSLEKSLNKAKRSTNVIWQALPVGLLFLAFFFLLQKSGILNFGIGGGVTPTTGFVIGLVASVSSCLAIVGGLILSLSATIAEDDKNNKKPFYLFHLGRLAGFAVLGGVLGLVGEAIGVSFISGTVLGVVASLVMILLGLHLVGLLKKNTFRLPPGIFTFFRRVEHQTFAPLLLGVGTFFLPCGFTQTMQVAALTSGTFVSGSLIMFSFALGTLPMLSLLSFGSASFAHSRHAPLFFKSAGVVVIGLGLFAFFAGLAGLGIINPPFNI